MAKRRRRLTDDERRQVIIEYDAVPRGGRSAWLKQNRMGHSQITSWRQKLGSAPPPSNGSPPAKRRGRPAVKAPAPRLADLEHEVIVLRAMVKLAIAKGVLDA